MSEKPAPLAPLNPTTAHSRVTVGEVMAASVVLAHGFIFLTPPDTFALSISYNLMRFLAPEAFWGVSFLALFTVWMFSVVLRRFHWRQVMLTILGLVILWMGVSFFLSNPYTTIGWTLIIVGGGTLAARVGLR